MIAPNWPAPPNVHAFVTTREGGVSLPPYQGFNLALHVGDQASAVEQNRQRLQDLGQICWLEQVHGSDCIYVDGQITPPPVADASFTDKPGVVCAVMTADCVPILLCDRAGTHVAAIHAGWRGLVGGVIQRTLAALPVSNAQSMAWIGPCISAPCFEVGDEVKEAFRNFPNAIAKGQREGKFFIDMVRITTDILNAQGVREVYHDNHCTYSDSAQFFSHRRATHEGLKRTGRMLSGILLNTPTL